LRNNRETLRTVLTAGKKPFLFMIACDCVAAVYLSFL